jgi:hypothetical protein
MHRINQQHLRHLFFGRARSVSDEAIRNDGDVPAEAVERLHRLARLVEICEAAQPPPPRRQWPVAALLVGTLLLVSVLLFARVPETEVELDVAVSETSFVLPTQQLVTDVLNLSALGVSGLQQVQLPYRGDPSASTSTHAASSATALRLAAASVGGRVGSMTLAALMLPANTRVSVRCADVSHQYRLSLAGSALDLRVDVYGPLHLAWAGAPAEELDLRTPRSVLLQSGPEGVDMDLTVSDTEPSVFSPQLSATDLTFARIDEYTDAEHTLVRRVSTILSGVIYFESLGGEAYPLRPGEALHFEAARGEIRTLQLEDDRIALKFHGRVRGMSSGSATVRRSLMPTYLDWLKARHGLTLLWGTTLYLFGLIAGVLRWWGVRL